MTWHFPIYAPIFILNVVLSIWLAIMVWQRRSIPGARVFAVMLIASSIWSFTRVLESGVDEVWAKMFWAKVEYFGTVVVSPAWFVFTCYYSRQLKRFPRHFSILLAIIPLITLSLLWTNESHHLIWTTISPTDNPEILSYGHGTWFWLAVVYNYSLLMSGILNLLYALRSSPTKYRSQAKSLLIGSLAPIIGNGLYLLGLSPIKGMDTTPFFLTITAIIYFFTVFRFRLFDIQRVARTAIIDNMRDGILVIDEMQHVVDVNPSALQLLGITNAIIAQDIRVVLAKYPTLLATVLNPQSQHITLPVDDTLSVYLDIQVSELNDSPGHSGGKLVILRDVTERRRNEKVAFETAIEQHRVQVLSQFIRDVSHEFKTPLSVINNSLYLMERSDDAEQQKKRREVIQLQTQRLDYLISEMLTTVQLDANSQLAHNSIHLNSLLESIAQQQMPIFKAKQQHLILNLSEKSAQILGDSLMLQKAVNNILENANRYTPNGGTITVTSSQEDEFATIKISDTGVGIHAESKNHIFERFFRVDDAHSTPGFGLGLPIAQSIIEKHQGWVDVESVPGSGTTFTIWLPQQATKTRTHPTLQLAPR